MKEYVSVVQGRHFRWIFHHPEAGEFGGEWEVRHIVIGFLR
jgi:hypothetical protein